MGGLGRPPFAVSKPALADWLRTTLSSRGERVESMRAAVRGTRTQTRVIETDRRRLVVKMFATDDDFARREFDSYQTLARHAPGVIVPLVAMDRRAGYLLLEHRDGLDLFGALAVGDPIAVMHALGDGIASVIIDTAALPGSTGTAAEERDALIAKMPLLRDLFASARVALPAATYDSIAGLCNAVTASPTALTQGDPAPSNLLFTDDGVRLLDFEYGARRNALFDLAQWYVRIPLPLPWFDALSTRVRARVVAAGVFASDDDFDAAAVQMCRYASLYMLTWLPVTAVDERDRAWVGDWTVRKAFLSTLHRFIDASHAPEKAALQSLASAMQSRWPEVTRFEVDWDGLIQSRRS